jgi:hypothetical protein
MRWDLALLHTNAVICVQAVQHITVWKADGRLVATMQQRLPGVDYAEYAFGLYLS